MEKKRCYGCMKEKTQCVCEHCGFDENTQNEPHQLPIGTVLRDQYLIGKVLGQGGFGITYLGWDRNLEMPIAVKEYYPSGIVNRDSRDTLMVASTGSNTEELFRSNRERFLREARTLAKLREIDEIVHVHNFFQENNTAYIIMEYVQGVTMKDYVRSRGGRITAQETFAILGPVMEALEKVHEAGIVHRDISPDNIMMRPNGRAKLLDFGAVREVANAEVDKVLTKSTEAILKHGFAPIEQYQSRGGLGPWTDVHALCATVYYCLTGKVPADAVLRVMGEETVDWDAVPGITDAQAAVLEKGMALMPKTRIRSVKELYEGVFGETAPVEEQKTHQTGYSEKGYPVGTVSLGGSAYPSGTVPLVSQSEELHTVPVSRPGPEPEMVTTPVAHPGPKQEPVTVPFSQPEHKGPEKKRNMGLIAAAAVVVLTVIIGIFAFGGKEETPEPQMQQPTETAEAVTEVTTEETTEPTQSVTEETVDPDAWRDNVLMADDIEWNNKAVYKVLRFNYYRSDINYITFLDSTVSAPKDAVDVSEAENGSVLAWVMTENGENHLYIAGKGGVAAPDECTYLFSYYGNLKEINFNGCFHTENVTNMSGMFANCENLIVFDLNSFSTSNVSSMINMFAGCSSLVEIQTGKFETSSVRNMCGMFKECSSLTNLDVSNFDTSNVRDMWGMYYGCTSLTSLDLSNFDTSNVVRMGWMFKGCKSLTSLDISNFNTSNVTDMTEMFADCNSLTEIKVGKFNTSNVTDYLYFMGKDKTFNGRPWEEWFE